MTGKEQREAPRPQPSVSPVEADRAGERPTLRPGVGPLSPTTLRARLALVRPRALKVRWLRGQR